MKDAIEDSCIGVSVVWTVGKEHSRVTLTLFQVASLIGQVQPSSNLGECPAVLLKRYEKPDQLSMCFLIF